jgi:hypothetical protein
MLTQTLIRRAAVTLAAVVTTASVWPAAATAAGGPAGGGFSGTQCGQSYTPSCTVMAGSPGSGSSAGDGTAAGSQSGGPDCTAKGRTVTCPFGLGIAGAGAAESPAKLAELAVRYLRLPSPVIGSSPPPGGLQLTGLPTWLWIAAGVWRPQSQTAQVPGESVTATAVPVSASWQMGDGATVICHGPGTPYTSADNPASASPTCGYTYTTSSAGQLGGAWLLTVAVTWDITWAGPRGTGGALPPLFTVAAAAMRVAEAQAVNTGGGA